jgi:predicted NUDIX family NTP pyrophosphohydrolase
MLQAIRVEAAMAKRSAGILLFRRTGDSPELFLVHPGGPFWAKKDDGAWSIPKGLHEPGEDALDTAQREFREETGIAIEGHFLELGEFKQPSGKLITAWGLEGDCDPAAIKSNFFSMEWPPKSGRTEQFPEVDRAAWFNGEESLRKIVKGQRPIIEKLFELLGVEVPRVKTAE